MSDLSPTLQTLLRKGVHIPHPSSVFVDEEVDPDRIHASARLYPGTRLQGAALSIGPEAEIGAETPATVINCQLAAGVSLKGGYFEGSVFLEGSSVGSSAHVRPGCLLEEEASAAHAVGLKQTILFPFVTLGSLINFCDVWMAGGTSRKNHSEVGSSFIHFNFTPHSDKATPSMIGDLARGLLLRQPPVFLGGQGGIVGPVEMEYGGVQAAGSICRRDLDAPGHLYQSAVKEERWQAYTPGQIRDPEGKWRKNVNYIASLRGLKLWYSEVRMPVMSSDPSTQACLQGALSLLDGAVDERLRQLKKWISLLPQDEWLPRMKKLESALSQPPDTGVLREIAEAFPADLGYVEGIRALPVDLQGQVQTFFEQELQRMTAETAST